MIACTGQAAAARSYPQPFGVVRVGVVGEGLFAAELEHIWRERHTVRIPQAAVQVDNDSHSDPDPRDLKIRRGAAYI